MCSFVSDPFFFRAVVRQCESLSRASSCSVQSCLALSQILVRRAFRRPCLAVQVSRVDVLLTLMHAYMFSVPVVLETSPFTACVVAAVVTRRAIMKFAFFSFALHDSGWPTSVRDLHPYILHTYFQCCTSGHFRHRGRDCYTAHDLPSLPLPAVCPIFSYLLNLRASSFSS